MNTKKVMAVSAIILGATGVTFTFLPKETLVFFGLETGEFIIFLVQVLGALYFAFAMLNWMTRASIIGGIYNRHVVVANLAHFLIVGLALIKIVVSNSVLPLVVWFVLGFYLFFAIAFGIMLFRHPGENVK